MQNPNLKLIKVAFTKKFKMSLYYTLNFENETYYAEAYREEGNWIRIKVLAKQRIIGTKSKFILYDGGLHWNATKLWLNKKTLKSQIPFMGARYAWSKLDRFPDELREKIENPPKYPWEKG